MGRISQRQGRNQEGYFTETKRVFLLFCCFVGIEDGVGML
jgi:hypothetical protein